MAFFTVGCPMNIVLNGELCRLDDGCTLQRLAEQQGLSRERFAVEVNLCIVPRSRLAAYRLCEGDRVEIVRAVGGG